MRRWLNQAVVTSRHEGGRPLLLACTALALLAACGSLRAGDQPQWGQRHSRNMVSVETGLPATFDPGTGHNVKWVAPLGTQTYASPVVAEGCVFVGTNNDRPRDPRHTGDRGILLCLNEADGSLRWQLVVPKLTGDRYLDWPRAGLASPPTVEGGRVYVVTNRAEVLCLDIDGVSDGNDGPFTNEGRYARPPGEESGEPGPTDADILWRFDMRAEAGVYPHDSAHSSILLHGSFLYLNTGNGVDNTHRKIRAPDAPSLIVLDKSSGRLLASDAERIGPTVFHCTWSSPALGTVGGQPLAFYGGGNGVCYAFEALRQSLPRSGSPRSLRKVWWFDCDPAGAKTDVHRFVGNREESPSNISGMPVFHEGRVYVASGGDVWWGKREARLTCVAAAGRGDITSTGQAWSYPLKRHCISTPAIVGGLVFIADCGGLVHCIEAATGAGLWTQQAKGPIWGSTLVADGKVYVGSTRRDFWVLSATREKRVIHSVTLDSPIHGTTTAANGVLYVPTMRSLYAFARGG